VANVLGLVVLNPLRADMQAAAPHVGAWASSRGAPSSSGAIEFFEFTQLDGDRPLTRIEPLPEGFRSFNGQGCRTRLVGEREVIRFGGDRGAQGSAVEGLEFA